MIDPLDSFSRMIFSHILRPVHCSQYVNRAAVSVRSALKEPAKSKLQTANQFSYNAAKWEAGEMGLKEEVAALSKAGAP